MNPNTQLATGEHTAYSEEQRRLVTDVLCKGATPIEVQFFLGVAAEYKLSALKRQIYAVKRWDSREKREVLQFQVGIEGLRAIASRTGEYVGSDNPTLECDGNGEIISATCTVWRWVKGEKRPFTATAWWDESVQTTKEGHPNSFWKTRPRGQISKCAEAAALRKAFPEEAGGLYTEEEIEALPKPESIQPTSQPVTQRPAAIEANAEIVTGEVHPVCWADLLVNHAWRNISVPEELKLKSKTVGILQRDRAEAAEADKQAKDGSNLRWALDCMRWNGIERTLASLGLTTEQFEAQCREIGLLKSEQSVFDTDSAELLRLSQGARNMQLARQEDEKRKATQEQPAE